MSFKRFLIFAYHNPSYLADINWRLTPSRLWRHYGECYRRLFGNWWIRDFDNDGLRSITEETVVCNKCNWIGKIGYDFEITDDGSFICPNCDNEHLAQTGCIYDFFG